MNYPILLIGKLSVTFQELSGNQKNLYLKLPGELLNIAGLFGKCKFHYSIIATKHDDILGKSICAEAIKKGIHLTHLISCEGTTPYSILTKEGEFLACKGEDNIALSLPSEIDSTMFSDSICYFSEEDLPHFPYQELWTLAEKNSPCIVVSSLGESCFSSSELFQMADILIFDERSAKQHSLSAFSNNRVKFILEIRKDEIFLYSPDDAIHKVYVNMEKQDEIYTAITAFLICLSKHLKTGNSVQNLNAHIIAEEIVNYLELQEVDKNSVKESERIFYAQSIVEKNASSVLEDPWRLQYHIAAPSGWINDPNGLIQINGIYHVFYQFHPFSAEWGPMYWGHATSSDLTFWHHEPIALAPTQNYEAGCWSGCAVSDNGILTLLYTGHNDENTIKECQCLARSYDNGKTFEKFSGNPIIPKYPKDGSSDFRDPKVWKYNDKWLMIVGTSKHKKGRALLYSSENLENWDYCGIFCESDGTQGSMWECPNFCKVDGQDLLIFSPMEMKGHKNVYCLGSYNEESKQFIQTNCKELDYGTNFYAAQVFEDESGRTILIAWMDKWGTDFPTQKTGWAGALTLPRELHMRNNELLQQPVPELHKLRSKQFFHYEGSISRENKLLSELTGSCLELFFRFQTASASDGFTLKMLINPDTCEYAQLIYDGKKNAFAFPHTLLPKKTIPDSEFIPCSRLPETMDVHIYIDHCSVEVFIDDGSLCITQRFYPSTQELSYELVPNRELIVDLFSAWKLKNAFNNI